MRSALLVMLLALVGCPRDAAVSNGGGAAPSFTPPPTAWRAQQIPAEWLACTQDSDCMVLELGCCDDCNGGRAIAINMAFQERPQQQGGCDGMACTEMACPEPTAVCSQSVCTLSQGSF